MTLSFPLSGGILAGGSGSGSVIKSVQHISTDMNFTGTTRNITISSVNAAFSIAVYSVTSGGNGVNRDSCAIRLTSNTNLELTKNSSSIGATQLEIQIIEFQPSSVRSVQNIVASGTISSDYIDSAITEVDLSKTIVFPGGVITSETTQRAIFAQAFLTSSTNVRMYVRASGSPTVTARASVVELK